MTHIEGVVAGDTLLSEFADFAIGEAFITVSGFVVGLSIKASQATFVLKQTHLVRGLAKVAQVLVLANPTLLDTVPNVSVVSNEVVVRSISIGLKRSAILG